MAASGDDQSSLRACPAGRNHVHTCASSPGQVIRGTAVDRNRHLQQLHPTATAATQDSDNVHLQGQKWHLELQDKAASVKTHCYYALKTCDGDVTKLRRSLDNITDHYMGEHKNCSQESRCKTDASYIPSKLKITDPKAEMLLRSAIRSLQIYKTPEDYTECMDTHYVESFNNAALQFHDKRIAFSTTEYKRRTNMVVLDWNENVDREYTSIQKPACGVSNRPNAGRKRLTAKTSKYVDKIWDHIVNHFEIG